MKTEFRDIATSNDKKGGTLFDYGYTGRGADFGALTKLTFRYRQIHFDGKPAFSAYGSACQKVEYSNHHHERNWEADCDWSACCTIT